MKKTTIIILLAIAILTIGCSKENEDEDDREIFAGEIDQRVAGRQIVWSGNSYGVRNGGRQAWRVPASVNGRLPARFTVCFPGDACYVGVKNKVARYPNGTFILGPDAKDRRSSHGGVYLHSRYGHKGRKAFIAR